jgi:hypothetical protein
LRFIRMRVLALLSGEIGVGGAGGNGSNQPAFS